MVCLLWMVMDDNDNRTKNESAFEMTYIVSGGALNSTHSLLKTNRNIYEFTIYELHSQFTTYYSLLFIHWLEIAFDLWQRNTKSSSVDGEMDLMITFSRYQPAPATYQKSREFKTTATALILRSRKVQTCRALIQWKYWISQPPQAF